MINIVPFLLVLSCNFSQNPSNIKKDLKNKSPKDTLQLVRSTTETSGNSRTEAKMITITVSYAAIECGCPQWFETKFKKERFLKDVERFYLEPTNKTLVNANDLWDGQTLPLTLKLVGRFSKNKELPKTYNTKTTTEKARIFWYDKIIIISSSKTTN